MKTIIASVLMMLSPSQLASGVYIYKIQSSDFISSKNMIILI